MSEPTAYDFAVLRVVPRVHLGTFVPVGVLVHARRAGFLGLAAITDPAALAARVAGVDVPLLARYLAVLQRIAAGDATAGPIALAPTSERFHWLTAPRSDVLQAGPVHEGTCLVEPAHVLAALFAEYVGA